MRIFKVEPLTLKNSFLAFRDFKKSSYKKNGYCILSVNALSWKEVFLEIQKNDFSLLFFSFSFVFPFSSSSGHLFQKKNATFARTQLKEVFLFHKFVKEKGCEKDF